MFELAEFTASVTSQPCFHDTRRFEAAGTERVNDGGRFYSVMRYMFLFICINQVLTGDFYS